MDKHNNHHAAQHARLREYNNPNEIQRDAAKFLKAHMFTEKLRKYKLQLTMQEYGDLRQMALNGDLKGAEKKLEDILGYKSFRGVM